MNLLSKLLKKYGFVALASIIAIIWIFAHWTGQPGSKISVLWGMVEYTKNNLSAINTIPKIPKKEIVSPLKEKQKNPDNSSLCYMLNEEDIKYPIFEKKNPFPKGLDIIKPGSSLAMFKTIFGDKTKITHPVTKITLCAGTFSTVKYLLDDKPEGSKVETVLFNINQRAPLKIA